MDQTPTRFNLVRRGVPLPDDDLGCVFCNAPSESSVHLFLLCPSILSVWYQVSRWLGWEFVCPLGLAQQFLSFTGLGGGRRLGYVCFLFGMLLFGLSGRSGTTLSFLVALSVRGLWWIESNSYLWSGSWLSVLLVPALSMSGRCNPSFVGSGSALRWLCSCGCGGLGGGS